MPRKNGKAVEADEIEAVRLSRELSSAISYVIKRMGYTQAEFARKIGLSRTTLNTILNSTERKNLWRLPTLCAVARVLSVSVPDLFLATLPGEHEGDDPKENLYGKAYLGSTDVGSVERLNRIIVKALNLFPDESEEGITERKDFKAFCGCRRADLEGCSKFYKAYTSCMITDEMAFAAVLKARSYVREHGGFVETPLWIGLRETFSGK